MEPALETFLDPWRDPYDPPPAYAELRATHGSDLAQARQKLFWFLCGWLGGPNHYIERFGHPRLRARHLPYAIGVSERDQWLRCMAWAMQDVGLSQEMQEHLMMSFYQTADWMRNQAGR